MERPSLEAPAPSLSLPGRPSMSASAACTCRRITCSSRPTFSSTTSLQIPEVHPGPSVCPCLSSKEPSIKRYTLPHQAHSLSWAPRPLSPNKETSTPADSLEKQPARTSGPRARQPPHQQRYPRLLPSPGACASESPGVEGSPNFQG